MRFQIEHSGSQRAEKQRVCLPTAGRNRREAGFILSFWEVLVCVILVAMAFGTILNGYVGGARMMQWSGYSLAAQSLSGQMVEQVRAAVWDIAIQKTEVTNMNLMGKSFTATAGGWKFTGYNTNILDVPWKGTNIVLVTNYVTVQQIYENNYTNISVQLQMIRVDTVWPFLGWGPYILAYYTNSVGTFMAPDNRDPSTLGVAN